MSYSERQKSRSSILVFIPSLKLLRSSGSSKKTRVKSKLKIISTKRLTPFEPSIWSKATFTSSIKLRGYTQRWICRTSCAFLFGADLPSQWRKSWSLFMNRWDSSCKWGLIFFCESKPPIMRTKSRLTLSNLASKSLKSILRRLRHTHSRSITAKVVSGLKEYSSTGSIW